MKADDLNDGKFQINRVAIGRKDTANRNQPSSDIVLRAAQLVNTQKNSTRVYREVLCELVKDKTYSQKEFSRLHFLFAMRMFEAQRQVPTEMSAGQRRAFSDMS